MELSPLIIYLWGIADEANHVAFLFAAMTVLGFSVLSFGIAMGIEEFGEDSVKAILGARRICGIMMPVFVAISILMPSSKTIAIMVIAPAIINSEPIQKDLPELYDMALDAINSNLYPEPEKE